MTKLFRVELQGDVREVYTIDAESEDDARARWAEDGHLVVSEAEGMEIVRVSEDA